MAWHCYHSNYVAESSQSTQSEFKSNAKSTHSELKSNKYRQKSNLLNSRNASLTCAQFRNLQNCAQWN